MLTQLPNQSNQKNQLSSDEMIELMELSKDPAIRAAVLLKAFSIPADIVKEVLDVEPTKVLRALQLPELNELYSKWSVKIKELSGDGVFQRLLPLAVYVQEKILGDETNDLKTRNNVADRIVDRVKGRPTQSLEVKSMNINVDVESSLLDEQIQATLLRVTTLENEQKKLLNAKSK